MAVTTKTTVKKGNASTEVVLGQAAQQITKAVTELAAATATIGLPVSRTIRTAPSRNSRSYFLRTSGMTSPHSGCLHTSRGCPTPPNLSR